MSFQNISNQPSIIENELGVPPKPSRISAVRTPKRAEISPSNDILSISSEDQPHDAHYGVDTNHSSHGRKRSGTRNRAQKCSKRKVAIDVGVAPNDIRRSYCAIFTKAFNSCDPVKISDILHKYCDSTDGYSKVSVAFRHEGCNQYGRKHLEVVGVDAIVNMWISLIKCYPDLIFSLIDHSEASYLPVDMAPPDTLRVLPTTRVCQVTQKFECRGTRTKEIIVNEKISCNAAKQGDSVDKFVDPLSPSPAPDTTINYQTKLNDPSIESETPLQNPSFRISEKPLKQRLSLYYTGTMVVYVADPQPDLVAACASSSLMIGKAVRIEFIYNVREQGN